MSDQNYQIKDNSSLHHYRTEIPNIIKSLKLTGNEFLLYFHYKNTAGDNGACWKSQATLSEETGLSLRTIIDCNKTLLMPRHELDGLSLITLDHRFNEKGAQISCIITIVDLWPINMTFCLKQNKENNKGVQNLHRGGAKFADKEEHINNLEEEVAKPIKKKEEAQERELTEEERDLYNRMLDNPEMRCISNDSKWRVIERYGIEAVREGFNDFYKRNYGFIVLNKPTKLDNPSAAFESCCEKAWKRIEKQKNKKEIL